MRCTARLAVHLMVFSAMAANLMIFRWRLLKLARRVTGLSETESPDDDTPAGMNCSDLQDLRTRFSLTEIQGFRKLVEQAQNANKTFFQWGSGGTSTLAAPWFQRSYVVETDPIRCEMVSDSPKFGCLVRKKALQLFCETVTTQLGRFARPKSTTDFGKFGPYFNAMEKVVASERRGGQVLNHFDVILVDGRFRVECALAAINFMNQNSILLIHDFWGRKGYHDLLRVFERPSSMTGFAIFKKPEHVDDVLVQELKEQYQNDYW